MVQGLRGDQAENADDQRLSLPRTPHLQGARTHEARQDHPAADTEIRKGTHRIRLREQGGKAVRKVGQAAYLTRQHDIRLRRQNADGQGKSLQERHPAETRHEGARDIHARRGAQAA